MPQDKRREAFKEGHLWKALRETPRERYTVPREAMLTDGTPLVSLGLPTRVINALRRERVTTVEGLCRCNAEQLLSARGLGETGLRNIHRALGDVGLSLAD